MDTLPTLMNGKDVAANWLHKFFRKEEPTDRDLKKARIASSYLATKVRAHQAETARERLKFSIARVISEDKNDFQKFIKASSWNISGRKKSVA